MIKTKPLLFYWVLAFTTALVLNIVFAFFWSFFSYRDIFLVLGVVQSPMVYFFFGLRYFEHHEDLHLSKRIEHAFAWMVLTLLMGVMIRVWFLNETIPELFSQGLLMTEVANFLALIIAGFFVHRKRNL